MNDIIIGIFSGLLTGCCSSFITCKVLKRRFEVDSSFSVSDLERANRLQNFVKKTCSEPVYIAGDNLNPYDGK